MNLRIVKICKFKKKIIFENLIIFEIVKIFEIRLI